MAICNHLAPNGEKSLLYQQLEQEFGSDKAHDLWTAVRSQQFLNKHGDWTAVDWLGRPKSKLPLDVNEEPTVQAVKQALRLTPGQPEAIEELFESNLKLANEVYEALGFGKESNLPTGNETINIYAGSNQNAELSNFAIRPFTTNVETSSGEKQYTFQNVEQGFHFYKALVANNPQVAKQILATINGGQLKRLTNRSNLKMTPEQVKEWDDTSKSIMLNLMYDSYAQNPKAAEKLLATGNAKITHTQDNTRWKTDFPEVVMTVRDMLKEEGFSIQPQITPQQKQEAQQLYSQYLESLNKPNTNPILQGNQQEQVKKFAELQERLNNKEFLEGAKNAFESSKGLQEWGTQEQYNDYIARVSLGIIKNPTSGEYNYESQVKDIVYRGEEKEDAILFQYWTNNKAEAYMYAKANITKGGKITERNPIPVITNNLKTYINNKYGEKTFESYILNKEDYFNQVSETEYELELPTWYKEDIKLDKQDIEDINALETLKANYDKVKIENEDDLDKPYTVNDYDVYKKDYDEARKQLDKYFNREEVGKIKTAILNIKNPYAEEIVQEDLQNDRDAYKNGHDGAFLMDGDHFLVKSNTNQIHILGGKQDVEGFKEFVEGKLGSNNTTPSAITSAEIYSQLGKITETGNILIDDIGGRKPSTARGIVAYRTRKNNFLEAFEKDRTIGNPWSHIGQGLYKTKTVKEAVEAFTAWMIGEKYTDVLQDYRQAILDNLDNLKGRKIIYYKELGEPSHATALDYLLNKYDWNTEVEIQPKVEEPIVPFEFMSRDESKVMEAAEKLLLKKNDGTFFTPAEQKEIVASIVTITERLYRQDPELGSNAILKAFGLMNDKRQAVAGTPLSLVYESIYTNRERLAEDVIRQLRSVGLMINKKTKERIVTAVRNMTPLTEAEKEQLREANPDIDPETTDIYSGEFLESVGRIARDWSDNSVELDPRDTASAHIKMFMGSLFEMDKGIYEVSQDGVDVSTLGIDIPNITRVQAIRLARTVSRKGLWYINEAKSEKLKAYLEQEVPIFSKENFLGLSKIADHDQVFRETLNLLGNRPQESTVEEFSALLQASPNPTLQNLGRELLAADDSLKNEFMTVMSKQYQPFVMCLFNNTDKGMVLNPIKANRFNQRDTLIKHWREQQKLSPLTIVNENGERVLDVKRVQERWLPILQDARAINDWSKQENREWFIQTMGDILRLLGVGVTDEMMEELYKNPKTYTGNPSVASLFAVSKSGVPEGLFSIFIMNVAGVNPNSDNGTDLEESVNLAHQNNPLYKENRLMQGLASLAAKYIPVLYSTNHRNTEGKSVWDWGMNTKLSHLFRDLTYSPESFEKFKESMKNVTIAQNNWLLRTLTENMNQLQSMELAYLDGLKPSWGKTGVNRQGMSDREQILTSILLFQNRGNGFNRESKVNYISLTHADKTMTPVFRNMPKADVGGMDIPTSLIGTNDSILYNIFKAEYDRIVGHKNITFNNKQYESGKSFFYFIPDFNHSEMQRLVKEGVITQSEFEYIWPAGGTELTKIIGSKHELPVINKILTRFVENMIQNNITKWGENGMTADMFDLIYVNKIAQKIGLKKISQKTLGDHVLEQTTGIKQRSAVGWMDTKTKKIIPKEEADARLVAYAAKDYAVNSFIFNTSLSQLFYGDPAEAWKPSKEGTTIDNVRTTMVEYMKRLAKDIAPRADLYWGNKKKYTAITLADVETSEKYLSEVEALKSAYADSTTTATDAQELTTVEEKIEVLFAQGKIPTKVYHEMLGIVHKAGPGGYYEFTDPLHLAVIFQPEKPLYAGNHFENGALLSDYVKSSAWALYPPLTRGKEIDKLRTFLEKNKISRAHFKSAKKLGSPNQPAIVFNPDGTFIEPKEFNSAVQVLDRKGFGIQQDVPYDEEKDVIKTLTQMNENITEGIMEMEGLQLPGRDPMTGPELKAFKETVRKKMIGLNLKALKEKLNIDENGNIDPELIFDLMVEEALADSRDSYTLNDIQSISVRDEDGTPMIPLMFNAIADRFESMLMGMHNKVPEVKMPGKSFVQASSVGMVASEGQDLSKVIRIGNWDGSPLKAMRPDPDNPGKVLPGQVILPFNFFDNDGNKLKVTDFLVEGTNQLDLNKIPIELLQLVGARIPNQKHSSMHPLEVVGFVPDNMGDLAFVPSAIVKQMGADFDVDKLYTYHRAYTFKDGVLSPVTGRVEQTKLGADSSDYTRLETRTIQLLKAAGIKPDEEGRYPDFNKYLSQAVSEAYPDGNVPKYVIGFKEQETFESLQNDYFDIHWSILTHPDMLTKVLAPLDKNDLVDEAALLKPAAGTYYNFFDPMSQLEDFQRGKEAKRLVGTTSWAVKFDARIQDKDLKYSVPEYTEAGVVAVAGTIQVIDEHTGEIRELGDLSGMGTSYYLPDGVALTDENRLAASRSKGDNHVMVQSEAVDNMKNRTLDNLNLTPETYKAVQAIIQLQDSNGWAMNSKYWTRLLTQPIIQEYSRMMKQGNDSLSDEYNSDLHNHVLSVLREKYGAPADILISPQLLIDPKMGYADHQVAALNLFDKFYQIGKRMFELEAQFNQDVSGAGLNLLTVMDKSDKMRNLESFPIMNATQIYSHKGKLTEVGYTFEATNTEAYRNLSQILPYDKFRGIFGQIAYIAGKTELSPKEKKSVLQAFKSISYTSQLHWWKDANAARKQLMFGSNSLARRLNEAKATWGIDNPLLSRLTTMLGETKDEADFIEYTAGSKIQANDKQSMTTGWLYMLMSEDETQRRLGEDLLRYVYLTGGVQDANSFVQFVPAAYLAGSPFSSSLKDIETRIKDSQVFGHEGFVTQYIQHNPYLAKAISKESLGPIPEGMDYPEAFSAPDPALTAQVPSELYGPDRELVPFVAYSIGKKSKVLYRLAPGTSYYTRIDVLGNQYSDEYDGMRTGVTQSIFPENQSKLQSLPDGMDNKMPAFKASRPGRISWYNELGIETGGITEANRGLIKVRDNEAVPAHIRTAAALLLSSTETIEEASAKALIGSTDMEMKLIETTNPFYDEGASNFQNEVFLNPLLARSLAHAAEVFTHEMVHNRLQNMILAAGGDRRYRERKDEDTTKYFDGLIDGYRKRFPEIAKHVDDLDRIRYEALLAFRNQIGEEEFTTVKELLESEVKLEKDSKYIPLVELYYALSSTQELVAHLTTNKPLMEFLNGVQSSRGTILSRIWDLLAEMLIAAAKSLGVEVKNDSLLKEALIHTLKLTNLEATRDVELTTSILTNAPVTVTTEKEAKAISHLMESSYNKKASITEGLLNYKVSFSNKKHKEVGQRGKVLDLLYDQLADVSEAINRTHIPEERLKLLIRRREVRDNIKYIHQEKNVDGIVTVGKSQLDWIDKVLASDTSTPIDINIALNTVKMWEDMVDILYGAYKDLSGVKDELKQVSQRAKDKRIELSNTKAIEVITEALKGITVLKEEDFGKELEDLNIVEANVLALTRAKSQLVNAVASFGWRNANNRDEEMGRVAKKLAALEEKMKAAGLTDKLMLDSEDENWGLVNRLSTEWHEHTAELLKNRNDKLEELDKLKVKDPDKVLAKKRDIWTKYWDGIKKAGTFVDIRAFFNPETGEKLTGETYTTALQELTETVGSEEYAKELVDQAQAKFKEYILQRDSMEDYLDSSITLTAEEAEGKDAAEQEQAKENKKIEAFNRWLSYNSPLELLNTLSKNKSVALNNESDQWIILVPRKSNKQFYNENFDAIKNDKKMYQAYKEYRELLQEMISYLPMEVQANIPDNFLPIVPKDSALSLSNVISKIRNWDTELLKSISATDLEEALRLAPDKIPVMYTKARGTTKDVDNRSTDLIRTLELFSMMALQHKYMGEVLDVINVAENVLAQANHRRGTGELEGEQLRHVNDALKYFKDALVFKKPTALQAKIDNPIYSLNVAKQHKIQKEVKELVKEREELQKQIEEKAENGEWDTEELDDRIADINEKLEEHEANARNVYGSKLADKLITVNQMKALAFNPLSAISNFTFGIISVYTHANIRKDFDGKSLRAAHGIMLHSMKKYFLFNETGDETAKKVHELMLRAGIMGDVVDTQYGESNITSKKKSPFMKAFNPYNWQKSGDYFTKGLMMVAMLKKKQIEVTEKATGNKSTISLWDAMDSDGKIKDIYEPMEEWYSDDISKQTEWQKQRDKIRKIGIMVFGNQDKNSPLMAKKNWLWRMAGQFRMSWFPEGVATRWKAKYYDPILERDVKGRWRTYGELGIVSSGLVLCKQLLSALPGVKMNPFKGVTLKDGTDLSESELDMENMRKNFAGLAWTVAFLSSIVMMRSMGDDEDKKKKKSADARKRQLIINLLTRNYQDLMLYSSPSVFNTVSGNLLPATQVLTDYWKAVTYTTKYLLTDEKHEKDAFERLVKNITRAGLPHPSFTLYNKMETMLTRDLDKLQR